jgi:hypothetical protein
LHSCSCWNGRELHHAAVEVDSENASSACEEQQLSSNSMQRHPTRVVPLHARMRMHALFITMQAKAQTSVTDGTGCQLLAAS